MTPFPKRFTTKDSCRNQFNMNIQIILPDNTMGLTTGWGDYAKGMVEIRRMDLGNIEFYHIQALVQVSGQIALLDIVKK